jgi:hypothetical protein
MPLLPVMQHSAATLLSGSGKLVNPQRHTAHRQHLHFQMDTPLKMVNSCDRHRQSTTTIGVCFLTKFLWLPSAIHMAVGEVGQGTDHAYLKRRVVGGRLHRSHRRLTEDCKSPIQQLSDRKFSCRLPKPMHGQKGMLLSTCSAYAS